MCGIIGYIGQREAVGVLLDGLKRLEYRGYDSAGVAVLDGNRIVVERTEGKLSCLAEKLAGATLKGKIGIGHTRWATHGVPSERNAHPHRVGDVVVVHNGIIENHIPLREELEKLGCRFSSETDSEIFCHLIEQQLKKTDQMEIAIRGALKQVRGSYALVVLHARHPDRLYATRFASPLVIGLGEGECLVASDVPALLPYTRNVIFLEDGEMVTLQANMRLPRTPTHIDWDPVQAEKGGCKHFMLKEILEQPRVVEDTLMGRVEPDSAQLHLGDVSQLLGEKGFPFQQVEIIACGTSWHAGMVGKYWLESLAKVPVQVSLASEFRYAEPLVGPETLVIPISQSGETADTIAAAQLAKERGCKILNICNVLGSSLSRMSDVTFYTHAGPEIGVASTKAFVAQLTVLYLLTLELAQRNGKMSRGELKEKIQELRTVPQALQQILDGAKKIRKVAERFYNASHFLFIARGPHYPVALEGALKLKEISYVHAEGFAAGELKHGPIAMIDHGVPVIALVPPSQTYEKILSNVEEVKSRGASVIVIGEEGDALLQKQADCFIPLPKIKYSLTPLLYAVPLQLFAYYIADHKGTDVDQPRNLAKSVTVE